MILFYVSSLNLELASIRYRAMLPALYLQRAGVSAQVRAGELDDATLQKADCMIVVKVFNPRAIKVCEQANRLGTPVILDLCDDIFDPAYGKIGGDMIRHHFAGMASMAASIVTTTPTLANKIRRHLPTKAVVHIVPDMVERASDVDALENLYRPKEIEVTPPAAKAKPKARPKLLKRLRQAMRRGLLGNSPQPKPAMMGQIEEKTNPKPPEAKVIGYQGRTILWYGHHGSHYSDTGMAQLLWLAGDLAKLAKDYEFRLVVISNNASKFDQIIRPLPFATQYVEWTPNIVHAYLKRSDVCVVPFGHDAFSLAKSPNRILLSLANGVPVVASNLPSLKPFKDCVLVEDWYSSIKTYFDNPDIVRAHLASAARVIGEHFDGATISEQWREVVRLTRRQANSRRSKSRILFFFQLMQDFELLAPLVQTAKSQFDISIAILAQVALVAPEALNALGKQGVRTFFLHEAEIATLDPRDPRISCDLLVTASESSADPHRFARQLTGLVKANNTPTITLQHGFENVGLTYKDERYDENISFLSDFVLIWGRPDDLPEWVSRETKSKVIPVGRPKSIAKRNGPGAFPLAGRDFIVVFENLHWSRYSDEFRARFLEDLAAAARAYPEKTFVLKPHPAGLWFTARRTIDFAAPDNVIVADPKSPAWEQYGAAAYIALARAVITTPSTTALDATQYDKPTAVVTYDVDAAMYDPLPRLASEADWINFVREVDAATTDMGRVSAFRHRVSLDGDAAPRVFAVFRAALNRGTRADLISAAADNHGAVDYDDCDGFSFPNSKWRLESLVDALADEELGELNTILDWNAWVTDRSGRAFGSSYSATKRVRAAALPDPRIVELDSLVPLAGKTVFEVGCFEGIHTTALCNFAQHVRACDMRVSLLAKTAVRCAFMGCQPELFLWNVEEELPRNRDLTCDTLHHVGVLYHLKDPVSHLQRILPLVREAVLLDTHVAGEGASDILDVGDRRYRVQRYREGGLADPFAGAYDHANWLSREDVIELLASHGFSDLAVDRLRPERNGPRVTIIAKRRR